MVDLLIYSTIFIFLVSTLFYMEYLRWIFLVGFTLVCLWIITAVNFFSLRHINKYTKLLKLEGIVANEKFVILYIGFLGMMAFCYTMQLVL